MRAIPALLCGLALVAGCGDDGDGGSGEDTDGSSSAGTTGMTESTTMDSGSTSADTSEATTEATSTTDDSASATGTGSADTGMAGDCQVWEITYDLEGSTFEISDTPFMAGDQVNTVTMPYDGDTNIGPGTFVLRFSDVDGAPGGMAAMVSYTMAMQFVVDSTVTVVETDITGDAGPDECGVTTGVVNGATVTWTPSTIVGHHSMGEILCTGNLCSAGGLPNGEPVVQDETSDQPITAFEFAPDFGSFTMAPTVIGMDDNSTNTWAYAATETGRELIDAPACLCN